VTTYAINPAPDVLAKIAFDPGWGHFEVFGIGRWFRDRVFNYTSATSPSGTVTNTLTSASNDTEMGGGLGGSLRVPLLAKHLDVGLKGLWGAGVGRYGNTTIADVTVRPDGTFSPLHAFSSLGTLELHATPRFDIYANYGGDYIYKTIYTNLAGKSDGYGLGEAFSGCDTEPLPTSTTLPAANSKCTGQTRDVQEGTLGYWYDIYKGSHGRLRQGLQYSHVERLIWDNLLLTSGNVSPKSVENMFLTSFRYYLP
jgi:hypothetical protein